MRNNFKSTLATFGLAAAAMFSSCIDKRQPILSEPKNTDSMTVDSSEIKWAVFKDALAQELMQWDSVESNESKTGIVSLIQRHKTQDKYIVTDFDIEQNEITKTLYDAKNGHKADTVFRMPLDQFIQKNSGDQNYAPVQPAAGVGQFKGPR